MNDFQNQSVVEACGYETQISRLTSNPIFLNEFNLLQEQPNEGLNEN